MGLVAGVLVLNLALAAVGYALLSAALRGSSAQTWLSFSGIALLTGAGLTMVVLCIAAVAGARTGVVALIVAAASVAAVGLGAGILLPPRVRARLAPDSTAALRESRRLDVVAALAATGVAIVVFTAVLGGFRTTPWLDDSWFMWLSKGIALDHLGLDARLFTPTNGYTTFTSPGYPWWWSILGDLDMRVVGSVDLRALNAQLALLLAAFVGGAARLLWGRVRPSLLWCGLLFLLVTPELLRQTQGGGADVVLALYLGVSALAAFRWLRDGRLLFLALLAVFAAAAIQIKDEGLPELLIAIVVLTGALCRVAGVRRVGALWAGAVTAGIAAIPWLAWRAANNVPSEISLGDGLHRLATFGAAGRLHDAASTLTRDSLEPRQWLVLVPLAVALSVAAALFTRAARPLALPAFLVLEFAFWAWVYWSSTDDLNYRLTTSAYRVVVTPIVLTGLAIPLLLETLAGALALRRRATPRSSEPVRVKIGS